MSTITFGALAPPLWKQLGVDPRRVDLFQKQADAITRLAVADLLTQSEVHRARTRLIKRIPRSLLAAQPQTKEGTDGR